MVRFSHAGLLVALVLAATIGSRATAQPPALPTPKPTVTITRAEVPTSAGKLLLPGTIEAWQETHIQARTDGYVRRWHKEIGEHVSAGELLVEIDTPETDQALAQARAAVTQVQARVDIARITYDRWRALVDKQTVSEHALDERRAELAVTNADLAAARANVHRLQEVQGFKRVTAPFAGIVTARNVENGSLIDVGDNTARELYRIAEVDRLRIRLPVPQTHLRAMQPGVSADVLVAEFPDHRFSGKIVRTAGAVDPTSRTLLTEIELPNADGTLLPGLYAQVQFSLPHPQGTVLVPMNSVRIDASGAHITTVGEDDKIKVVTVILGRNLGLQIEVVAGLAASSQVVLNPTDELTEGIEVVVKEPITPTS